MITNLNNRSREVFKQIVDAYLETGGPIGSRNLTKRLNVDISAATVRNVMADLEEAGLLSAPHISAGRLPTEAGLRLFVDGLLEVGNLTEAERRNIDEQCAGTSKSLDSMLEEVTTTLSGLSQCASLVVAPKADSPLKHIEFVNLSPGRSLVIMVSENGIVENRIINTPPTLPASALVEATNYLSARLVGRTVEEASGEIIAELEAHRSMLDQLTSKVVESGLATWAGDSPGGSLIVRGQSHLLDDVSAVADLEAIRSLFTTLETKEEMVKLLTMTDDAEGVQIFIGADNDLFDMTGCSMIVSPYHNSSEKIVGAIGVIGPTRMNYAKIIPMVDYTAKLIGRVLG